VCVGVLPRAALGVVRAHVAAVLQRRDVVEDVGVQHLVRDHHSSAANARCMAVADALAARFAVSAAEVLEALALTRGVIPHTLRIHVLAVVRDKDRGRDTKILALLFCVAVVAAPDVDEAAVLVVIAVLVDVGLERPSALVRPLVLGTEDIRARIELRERAFAGGNERSRGHSAALHEVFRLAVRVHPICRVVVVPLAMAVNARLPCPSLVQAVMLDVAVHVVRLARGQVPLATADSLIADTALREVRTDRSAVGVRDGDDARPG